MSTTTAALLSAARTFSGYETPKSHRVSRCVQCDRAYAWKGSAARPACPACGGALTTTTRMLKRTVFIELAGELLTIAELKPNGLEAAAAYEERHAANLDERVSAFRQQAEREPNRYRIEAGELVHYRQVAEGSWDASRGAEVGSWLRSGSEGSVDGLAERAAKHRIKAERYRRRAAKLAA